MPSLKISVNQNVFAYFHSGRKRPKKKNKPSEPSGELKDKGEECEFISGSSSFPWGHCALPVSCPGGTKLNCVDGLHCCRNWTPKRWISLKNPQTGRLASKYLHGYIFNESVDFTVLYTRYSYKSVWTHLAIVQSKPQISCLSMIAQVFKAYKKETLAHKDLN